MTKRVILSIVTLFLFVAVAQSEVVVLTDKPVAEFTLPDGSVLKNAFAWRRNSEGIMIIHDDGQHFLNFSTLPDDWKAAYLGADAVETEPEVDAPPPVETTGSRHGLQDVLATVQTLTPAGRGYLTAPGASEQAKKDALTIATLQALLKDNDEAAKRFYLIIEEREYEIESVDEEILFVECATCGADGGLKKDCTNCGGSGNCPRCDGAGERSTGFKDRTMHCTTCKGTGSCADCAGAGGSQRKCGGCAGRGKRLEKNYCEVKRDQLARAANAAAENSSVVAITKQDIELITKTMKELPNIEPSAIEFYLSDDYSGSRDEEILAACALQSLLKRRGDAAERLYLMLEIHYPESEVMDVEKYLEICESCEGDGLTDGDCRTCEGTGKCDRCEGDGQRETGFKDRTTHCTTCRGNGNCVDCRGAGDKRVRCGVCSGRGRFFKEDRAEIKLDILIETLNRAAR